VQRKAFVFFYIASLIDIGGLLWFFFCVVVFFSFPASFGPFDVIIA